MTTAATTSSKPPKDYSQPETYPVLVDFEAGRLDDVLFSGSKEQRLALLALARRTAEPADRELMLRELARSITAERQRKTMGTRVEELTALLAAERPEVPAIEQYMRCAEMYVRDMVTKTEKTTEAIKKQDPASKALGYMHWLEHEAIVARDGLKFHGRKLVEHLQRGTQPQGQADDAGTPGTPTPSA